MAKKKAPSKTVSKPKMVLRQIDPNTRLISDNPMFPEVPEMETEKLPKGYVRADKNTVVKVG